jgi:hypothetical protein
LRGSYQVNSAVAFRAIPYRLAGAWRIARDRVCVRSVGRAVLRNNVRSHDPAEALLHLLLLRLYEADPGYVNQPDLPPEVALAALGQVLSEAAGKPVEDAPPQVQHVLLASGQWLLCARRGPQPLWFRELRGLGDDQSFAAVLVHAELHPAPDAAAAEEAAIAAGALEVPDNHALLVKANLGHLLVPLSL